MINVRLIQVRLSSRYIRLSSRWIPALLLACTAAVSQSQTPPRADSAARAPGVTRAVEHPDAPLPDPTVDQTLTDERQPETAVDHEPGGPETAVDHEPGAPETARDDQRLKPETASDAPKPSSSHRAAEIARQGVRSNAQPPRPHS